MHSGKQLEADVQSVFSVLLNLRDEGVVVSKDAVVRGKSGRDYRVDVYYEFVRAGLRHRVVIECKDLARPVEGEEVLAFHAKLQDIPNATGVFIARGGFQKAFREYADHHGITYLRFADLPQLPQLIAMRLGSVALPDETYLGEPFWCLMEIRQGETTGSHFGIPDPTGKGRRTIPLFYSRQHAQLFLDVHEAADEFAVRGLPQHALRGALLLGHVMRAQFLVAWGPQPGNPKGWAGPVLEPTEVARQYYLGTIDFNEVRPMPA